MTKSLASVRRSERDATIARRLASGTKGLGYYAAVDAKMAKIRKQILAPKVLGPKKPTLLTLTAGLGKVGA